MARDNADIMGEGGDGRKLGRDDNRTVNPDDIAKDQLAAFVDRIERLEEEKKGVSDDIKEVYSEAKGNGFDTKVLRKLIAVRKQDASERAEQEAILDLYLAALGMRSE